MSTKKNRKLRKQMAHVTKSFNDLMEVIKPFIKLKRLDHQVSTAGKWTIEEFI